MKIVELCETQELTEYFSMSYDAFGWILPGGRVAMATPAQAKSPQMYIHTDVGADLGKSSYREAFNAGWVRWLVLDDTLSLEYSRVFTEEIYNTIAKGVPKLEKTLSNPKKFAHFIGRKARSQSSAGEPLMIMRYVAEVGMGDNYAVESSNSLKGLLVKLKTKIAAGGEENADY